MRTNETALRAICKAICNTCYVDKDVLYELLAENNISPEGVVDDLKSLVRIAIVIVKGWVETSRSEGGISASISPEQIDNSIRLWCGMHDIDADELLSASLVTIENGSNLW